MVEIVFTDDPQEKLWSLEQNQIYPMAFKLQQISPQESVIAHGMLNK